VLDLAWIHKISKNPNDFTLEYEHAIIYTLDLWIIDKLHSATIQ